MKKLLFVFLSAAIIACNSGQKGGTSGTAGNSEASDDTAVTTASVDTTILNFIHNAAMINGMEIESGQLAQQKARSAEVKAFAGRMVQDHTKAMVQLKAIADRMNVELPMLPDMNKNLVSADNTNKLNKLQQRTGADFDREYMKMMVEDHRKAISLFQKASQNNDAGIKSFAEQMLPVLGKHEADSKSLLSSLK